MKHIFSRFLFGLIVCSFVACLPSTGKASPDTNGESQPNEKHGLTLSDMRIKVTSQGHTATFQLYDTTAARELYEQLPLKLDLTNFRDAQWMFYPPEKLNVTAREAYHDGKKGELSYYKPWGDVFMLYKDFHAGDRMHRLGIGLTGVDAISEMAGSAAIQKVDPKASGDGEEMKITVKSNGNDIVFELNDSQAAKDLYSQLPLSVPVENHGSQEKIFYPPKKLSTGSTPKADAKTGTLAYYAPWGDVVMFYGDFGSAAGLYELGDVVSGSEHIQDLSGTIRIQPAETP
jgi:hypothetical protein